MKKFYAILCLAIASLAQLQAQAPQGFNYQDTVRNSSGDLIVNTNVYFKFNVIQGSQTAVPIFTETHYVPTDDLGQVNLVIGQGTANTGVFSELDWSLGSYYLGIELDTGNGYVAMGTTQLLSVPYALYAENSGNSIPTTPNLETVLAENNSANNQQIKDLQDPTDAQDAVTLAYVSELEAQIEEINSTIDNDNDGFSENQGDCNDDNPEIYPNAEEIQDGVDNDCDGQTDESNDLNTDDDGDGYTEDEGDCNDSDASIYPGAIDMCDGIDSNCDGEDYIYTWLAIYVLPDLQYYCLNAYVETPLSAETDGAILYEWFSSEFPGVVVSNNSYLYPDISNVGITSYWCKVTTGDLECDYFYTNTTEVHVVATPSIESLSINVKNGDYFDVSPTPHGFYGCPTNGIQYTWDVISNGSGASGSGASFESTPQSNISQSLINLTNSPLSVVYSVTPTNGFDCEGLPFELVVTVSGSFIDFEGNNIQYLPYGNQIWTVDNAKVTTYRDGTIIPQVTDPEEWSSLITGAWTYYNNDPTKGKLYNWYAVMGIHDTDPSTPNKEFAPEGWHIPSENEWNNLYDYLISNGYNYDCSTNENKILKAVSSRNGWAPLPNVDGSPGNNPASNNISGFDVYPTGFGNENGFIMENSASIFWSSTESDINSAKQFQFFSGNYGTTPGFSRPKNRFLSIRFIKD